MLVDVVDHTDSGWNVTGSVTVGNPNDYMSVEASVEVDLGLEGAVCTVDETADVDAETSGVQVSLEAAGGASLGFDCTLTSLGGEPVVATATIVWDGGELAVTSEPIEFEFRTYNGYVAVYDYHGNPDDATLLDLISVDDAPAAYDYTIEFTGLSAACEIVTNTAWVELVVAERATGAAAGVSADEGALASDQVDVTICPPNEPLTLEASGAGTFDREYLWSITKRANVTKKVAANGKATFDYVVQAIPGDVLDSGYAAGVELVIGNPNRADVTATVAPLSGPAGMTCTVTAEDADPEADGTQVVVPAGKETTVGFGCTGTPTAVDSSTLKAAVTFVDSFGETQSVSASADIAFAVDTETNRTITVYDDLANPHAPLTELGKAEWNDKGKATRFRYRLMVFLGAGDDTESYTNTAQIGDDGPKASVTVTVIAAPGAPSSGFDDGAPVSGLIPAAILVGAVGLAWWGTRRKRS